jgi:hypothetical protein
MHMTRKYDVMSSLTRRGMEVMKTQIFIINEQEAQSVSE